MQKLIKGLHHFQSHVFDSHKELFKRLAGAQNPDALFITCSDSRINPNLITHTDPGDLFVLRNAGNIIPPFVGINGGEAATIEFAVRGLGVKDIVVCGHSGCGAMSSLLRPDRVAEMPLVSAWISQADNTLRFVKDKYRDLGEQELLNVLIQENVLTQLENLRTQPAVADRLDSGSLHLHAWVYKIETGEVFVYQSDEGQFKPLTL